jgi:cell division septum initiation protein DivIVA
MSWLRNKLRKGARTEPVGAGAEVARYLRELRARLTVGRFRLMAIEACVGPLGATVDTRALRQDLDDLARRVEQVESRASALIARQLAARSEIAAQEILEDLRYGETAKHLARLEADVDEAQAQAAAEEEVAQWQAG